MLGGGHDGKETMLACLPNEILIEVVSVLQGLRSQVDSGPQSTCSKMYFCFRFQMGRRRKFQCSFSYILDLSKS